MKIIFYKKTFFVFLCLSVISLFSIMAFNYYADPANQFYRAYLFPEKVANVLLNKKEAMINANYNERSLQKLMLEKLPTQPEILFLGSSHSLPINHSLFKNSSFYNASVSAGTLEDDMALYYVYKKRGWQPKTVVICLDPWIIDKNLALLLIPKGKEQWKTTLTSEYYAAKTLVLGNVGKSNLSYEKINGLFDKYSQLLSVDYLKASMKQMRLTSSNSASSNAILTSNRSNSEKCPSCYTLLPDGARMPTNEEELTSASQADLTVINQMQQAQPSSNNINNVVPLDSEYKNIFEHFVNYLIANNVKVIFYFPPLEPMAYSEFVEKNPNYKSVKIAEQYFSALAMKYHLKIIGSYDPIRLSLNANDFIDSWHLKKEGVQKIFKGNNDL